MAEEWKLKEELDEEEQEKVEERDEKNDTNEGKIHQPSRGKLEKSRDFRATEHDKSASAERKKLLLRKQHPQKLLEMKFPGGSMV